MRTAEDVAALYEQRKSRLGPLFAQMADARDVYNGDIVIPLPELSQYEKSSVANLTQQGLDQLARRSNSVMPNMVFPPLRQGIKISEQRADDRRKVVYGWHEATRLRKVNGRRHRWYYGYGSAPVIVRPDPDLEAPRWEPVSPLDFFPAPTKLDCYTPDDAIIRHRCTIAWVEAHYDTYIPRSRKTSPDTELDMLEYHDADEVVCVVLAVKDSQGWEQKVEVEPVEVMRYPNRAGMCWAVNPGRLSLDRLLGHFDGILGMHQTQAALMSMQILATRRGIMPREWLVANPGQAVSIIQDPDPSSGIPGVIQGGTIQEQHVDPSFQALAVIDRLDTSQRQSAGLPVEFGGMASTNVRTGRRGAQVMSAAIDFTIAEAQDAFAESLFEENRRAMAIDKGYFAGRSKTVTVSTKGAQGQVTYTPSELWETDQHIVEYPLAGTDLSDLVINAGQRVGMETMSKRSFMEIDPLVNDADAEERRLRKEKVEGVFFASSLNQLADPAQGWSPVHFAEFARRIDSGEEWWEAFTALQKQVQAEQAEAAQAAPQEMPGMMAPGQGGEVPSVAEQGPSMRNMTSLLSSLGVADQALRMR